MFTLKTALRLRAVERKVLVIFLVLMLGLMLPVASLAQNSRGVYKRSAVKKKEKASKNTKASSSKKRPSYYVNQDGDTVGTPWTGSVGITRSVAEIMAEQELVGTRKTFREKKEERELPDRKSLPQNPEAPAVAKLPDDGLPAITNRTESVAAPQTVSTTFDGATLTDTLSFPPDTMGAVGPTQFIVCVNGWMRSFNKNTGAADGALNVDMDVFFSSVRNNAFTTDPRIRYDRISGRWFIIIINAPASGANRVLFAVSSGSNITSTSNFTFFFFQQDQVSPAGDTGFFSDYPSLGIDANALYIGVNQFNGNNFAGTTAFVVRKSSITGAGPIVASAFRGLIPSPPFGAGLYTPQGVDNFDPNSTTGYFIGVDNATFSLLKMRRVTNPGGTPVLSSDVNITVPTTTFPIDVPHLGNTGGANGALDALDDRLFMAQVRGNSLWTCHNIQVNSSGVGSSTGGRNASRWYEINNLNGTPAIVQSGTLFDNAATNPRHFWIPSINVTGQGHVALGVSSSGANDRVNAATAGRLTGDTLGTLQAINIFTNTTFSYNPASDPGPPRRWGDYSYTSVDPEDDMTMWTVQQWVQANNSYAVRVAKLLAPPPASPTSVSPNTVAAGQTSVNVTITGTQSNGSGFFDPGAGFVKRLAVSIPGVTVNSVTFNSPTSVTANLNTVGVSQGQKNITVTNPDGQAATGNNLLTISGGGPGGGRARFVDFDDDDKTDISIFRPSLGQWWIQRSSDSVTNAFTFGSSSDKLVPADYDGDGKTDVAFWRPSTGQWFVLRSSNNTFFAAPFGSNGDIPAPGYFDNDNIADFAVFRPSNATWFILKSTGGVQTTPFGLSSDIPVVADYDGDTTSDIAIFRPTGGSGGGEWWILRSSGGIFATPFGAVGDKPVQGDYTGDGKADIAFFRPSTNNWFVLRSEDLSFFAAPFGASGDVAVPGDYDGDNKNDFAVFRPSNNTWFVSRSTGGTIIQGFGTTGDIPVPSAFVP